MLDVEEQINRVADAAFKQTSPVPIPSQPATRPNRNRWLAAAAAVGLVIIGATVALGQLRDPDTTLGTAAQGSTYVDGEYRFSYIDPLMLDLDAAIDVSGRDRLNSLGPLLSFDLDALPEGWTAAQTHAITLGTPQGPSYWQQVEVTSPEGTRLVMNITGLLADEPLDATSTFTIDGSPTQVRDQPGRIGNTGLQWIEQGQILVSVIRGRGVYQSDISSEMLAFGDVLAPRTTELTWDGGDDLTGSIGQSSPDSTPLLAGTLAGTDWAVAQNGIHLRLLIGEELRYSGATPHTVPDDGNTVHYSIDPISLPGGVLVFGRSPGGLTLVRLHLKNAVVDLPVTAMEDDQVAFAVPISDQLDPLRITLHDMDETLLATIPLESLPPYLGGSLSTGVRMGS